MEEASCFVRAAESLFTAGRLQDALEAAERGVEQFPDEGKLWKIRAALYHRAGDFGTAASSIELAGMLVPLSRNDQLLLADCYVRTERGRHAREIYLHLADETDCAVDLLPAIAAGLGRVGDPEAAVEVCRRASKLEPDRPEPLFGMVFYLRKLGHSAATVIPTMARAVELAPNVVIYRSTLAFLLSEAGRTEEAYDLLRDLPLTEVGCVCQVRRMMTVFQAVGDYARWQECHQRLGDTRQRSH